MTSTPHHLSIDLSDSVGCSQLTVPGLPSSQPVVRNYYLSDTSLPAQNLSLESLSPSASRRLAAKRPRGPVDPYDRAHQGRLQAISASAERDLAADAVGFHQRRKLARLEPLPLDAAGAGAEIRALREQYESLRRAVDETRAELQRSRAESQAARSTVEQTVTELRVELGQNVKHVELLDGRQTTLEKSIGDMRRTQALVDACREDIALLRTEIGRKEAAIAVLERSVAEIVSQSKMAAQSAPQMQPAKPAQNTQSAQQTGQSGQSPFPGMSEKNTSSNNFWFGNAANPVQAAQPVQQAGQSGQSTFAAMPEKNTSSNTFSFGNTSNTVQDTQPVQQTGQSGQSPFPTMPEKNTPPNTFSFGNASNPVQAAQPVQQTGQSGQSPFPTMPEKNTSSNTFSFGNASNPVQAAQPVQQTGQVGQSFPSAVSENNPSATTFSFGNTAKPSVGQSFSVPQVLAADAVRTSFGQPEPAKVEQNSTAAFGLGSAGPAAPQPILFAVGSGAPDQTNANSNANGNTGSNVKAPGFLNQGVSSPPVDIPQSSFAQPLQSTLPFATSQKNDESNILGTRPKKKATRRY